MEKRTSDILRDIDEKELLELLVQLIRIPSPTGEEKEIAQYIASYAKSAGFASVHVSDQWDVVARLEGENRSPRILFLTHTDHAKPANPKEAYNPVIVDGQKVGSSLKVVTGKGSAASKGVLAAMLYAGRMLTQKKRHLRGSLIIAAVSRDLLANHDGVREVAERGWIDAEMAISGEPSDNQPIIGARGISHIAITIHGKPTHWGKPTVGINPIWTIGQLLRVIKELIADLPSHPSLGNATLAPIDIHCEMSPPLTPSSCCLVLDRRMLPGEDTDAVIEGIREKLGELKLEKERIVVDSIRQMYPFEGNPESLISRKVKEINEAVTGKRLPYGFLSFSSNGGFLWSRMKIPSVIYGPGRIEDLVPNFCIQADSILQAASVYAGTAFEILGVD